MIIVTSETSVLSWGTNTYGQLGHGDREYRSKPTVVSNLNGRNIMRCILLLFSALVWYHVYVTAGLNVVESLAFLRMRMGF